MKTLPKRSCQNKMPLSFDATVASELSYDTNSRPESIRWINFQIKWQEKEVIKIK